MEFHGINYDLGNIDGCSNNVRVEATEDEVGGICGINKSNISSSNNRGYIISEWENSAKVGGICGENSTDSFIYNSYNLGNVKSVLNAGGIYGANFGTVDGSMYTKEIVESQNISDLDFAKVQDEINIQFGL